MEEGILGVGAGAGGRASGSATVSGATAAAAMAPSSADENGYYAYLDSKTNNGVVFNEDLSILPDLPERVLTDIEKSARRKWLKVRAGIMKQYGRQRWPEIRDTDDLLGQRILAPCMVTKNASTRSRPAESRAGRRYPATLAPWDSFSQEVADFRVPCKPLEDVKGSPFEFSADNGDPSIEIRDERQEELFLVGVLNRYCGKYKLVGQLVSAGPVIGQPDVMAMKTGDIEEADSDVDDSTCSESEEETQEDVSVLCEFKSTHNLPLPMSAHGVCATYNEADEQVYEQRVGRTDRWSRTCHPIGQLLGYMVDNSKRYGILSSGTRTYFLRIRKDDDTEVVEISDAMFVGQANYIKAWVYIHQLDGGDDLDPKNLDWQRTTAQKTTPGAASKRNLPPRDTKKDDSSGRPAKAARLPTSADASGTAASGTNEELCVLPSVPFSQIRIINALGQGRNGTVFLADWKGQKVALKQFDTSKSGLAYDQEVRSYIHCKKAWGRLVPTPFFVSESWSGGTRFLALQVGRRPRSGDDVSKWREILDELEEEFGLRHEDCDARNMLFIPNGEKECLVAVDLEDITMVH